MQTKWLELNLGVYDFCPKCKQRVSVELVGLNVENLPKTIQFFCVDCGAWEVPVNIDDLLKKKE